MRNSGKNPILVSIKKDPHLDTYRGRHSSHSFLARSLSNNLTFYNAFYVPHHCVRSLGSAAFSHQLPPRWKSDDNVLSSSSDVNYNLQQQHLIPQQNHPLRNNGFHPQHQNGNFQNKANKKYTWVSFDLCFVSKPGKRTRCNFRFFFSFARPSAGLSAVDARGATVLPTTAKTRRPLPAR